MSIVNFECDVCAITDVGLVRPHNEDSNRVSQTPNGDLFVVCDGMGGHVGGATASRIGADSICQYINEHACTIPQQFLVKALEFANNQIYSEAKVNPELRGMGTTACVALVREDKVWYAHVGDSRIYYFNARKRSLFRLTKDHSVVQALVDQGLITEEEAEHHPEKNKIRKSLGIKEDVEPEPCQMPLIPAEGDILLVCSDGLSGMMSEDDILEVLTTTPEINEAGKMLVELAKSGGGTDNITVQLIRFSNVGDRDAVFEPKNCGISKGPGNKSKPRVTKIWPWIIIAVSAIMLFIALLLFIPSKPQSSGIEESKISTNNNPEPAYLQLIPSNRKPDDTFNGEKGTEWAYYKSVWQGNDIIVNLTDYSYRISKYVKSPNGRYIPADGSTEKRYSTYELP